MSTSIENLRRLAQRDVKDHTAIFDLYVTLGRDLDYLAIKFGINPDDLVNLLEGYGEKISISDQKLDLSGKGRYRKLSRLLIEEYIEKFYPGIASENPENDWICLEAYLDMFHQGWRGQIGAPNIADPEAEALPGEVKPVKTGRRKMRNTFKLY